MVPLRPPDPPFNEGMHNDEMNVENEAQITPPEDDGASGVTILMTRLMADKSNYNANGDLIINKTMLELFHILIQSERKRDEKLKAMANRLDNLIELQSAKKTLPTGPSPMILPSRPTYAERAMVKTPPVSPKTGLEPTHEGRHEII